MSLLRRLGRGDDNILGDDSLIIRQFRVARANSSADGGGVAWDTAQGLDFGILRVVGSCHSGMDVVVFDLVRGTAGELRAGGAVRVGTGSRSEVIGRNTQATAVVFRMLLVGRGGLIIPVGAQNR